MAKFKIGDKVIAKNDTPYTITTNGWRGVVVGVDSYGDDDIKVSKEYDEDGFWVNSKYFDLDVEPQDAIVITVKGRCVTAKKLENCKVVKTSEAKCNPADEFDINVGIKLALDRLNEVEVGDTVKIVNAGKIYPKHEEWVLENVKKKRLIARWSYNYNPYYLDNGETKKTNHVFKVVAKAENKVFIQGHNCSDACYLIGIDGVEKC